MKPIFKFTSKEISDELYEILNRLKEDKTVYLEEIEQTPEFILGQNMCERGIETIYLSDRKKMQDNIVKKLSESGSVQTKNNEIFYTGKVDKNKRLDIVIGLPASGKSSAITNVISKEAHSMVLDNDEVKKLIPEYKDGWGTGIVHMESKKINRKILNNAFEEGKNIVLPKVGGYADEIISIIKEAKEKDYTVNLHYVELNRNIAVLRLLNRFITDGRFISPRTVYQDDNEIDGNKINKTFKCIVENGIIDGYSHWDNNVEKGCPPKLINSYNLSDNFIKNVPVIKTNKSNCDIITGKNILFKRLNYYMDQNNNLFKLPQNISIEKLNLLLETQKRGITLRSVEFLNNKNKKFNNEISNETLTEKIDKYKTNKQEAILETEMEER